MQVEKPRREDVECLAKLMATVGSHLDRHARGREFMDAYFLRINTLKESKSLPESRLRFLLQVRRDIIPKIADTKVADIFSASSVLLQCHGLQCILFDLAWFIRQVG